jgi:predicted acylesterase/phospholipase RssA
MFLSDARGLLSESLRRTVGFFRSSGSLGERALDLIDIQAFISGEPYMALVERSVDLDAVRRSTRVLRIAATDWQTGAVRVFGNADMADGRGHRIVAASGAVPGIFPTIEIDGVPYVDGGVLLNTPLRPAIEAGADVIHLISVNPELSNIPLPRTSSTVNTFYRLMAVSLAGAANRDIEIAARLNDGIEILERAQRGEYLAGLPMQALVLAMGGLANRPNPNIPYRRLTVHRHQLGEDFGNFLQWLDFDRDRLAGLIEQGTRDAIAHDCVANGCVLR